MLESKFIILDLTFVPNHKIKYVLPLILSFIFYKNRVFI